MPTEGIHSVTIPGAVRGWGELHARFGTLPWKSLFDDAIAFADEGFPVHEGVAELWNEPALLHRIPPALLLDGRPPREGEIFRNPEMAHALRSIAANWPGRFLQRRHRRRCSRYLAIPRRTQMTAE